MVSLDLTRYGVTDRVLETRYFGREMDWRHSWTSLFLHFLTNLMIFQSGTRAPKEVLRNFEKSSTLVDKWKKSCSIWHQIHFSEWFRVPGFVTISLWGHLLPKNVDFSIESNRSNWGLYKALLYGMTGNLTFQNFRVLKKHSKTPRRVARLMQNTEVWTQW